MTKNGRDFRQNLQKLTVLTVSLAASAGACSGSTITYTTAAGATTSGGPVKASATFTTGAGTLLISLTDSLANPNDVAQTISDLEFVLSNGATSGTLTSSSAQEINIASNGTYVLGSNVSTGWGLLNNVNGGLQLEALGFAGPEHLIIGGPGSGGIYNNANGSIAGNGPHNPFLNQTANFQISIPGLTAAVSVTSVKFSFGTTLGTNTVTSLVQTPEPSTAVFLLCGCFGFAMLRGRRRLA